MHASAITALAVALTFDLEKLFSDVQPVMNISDREVERFGSREIGVNGWSTNGRATARYNASVVYWWQRYEKSDKRI